jgi:hypothetical protein
MNGPFVPTRHQKHQAWAQERLINWAEKVGLDVKRWVSRQLEIRDRPEQACRACLGLLNLDKKYPSTRLLMAT